MQSVLIANRGEIAVRIARTCRALGLTTVAVHSTPDAEALHVKVADKSFDLGGTAASENYLDSEKILEAAAATGAEAVHPGYGFLSENAEFAQAVLDSGLIWIGPPPSAIVAMGDKVAARAVAAGAGVAGVPGSDGPVEVAQEVSDFGASHGWPVVIKAAAGGGGRGMRVVRSPDQAEAAIEAARREALASFGDDTVYVERYLEWPRHVEVQVLADGAGAVVALGERDCSVQRRHQKLVEEAPAPGLSDDLRARLHDAAVAVTRAVDYRGAGTLEFLVEDDEFFFLEMNTRLQVEHPVTELVFGVDLVAEQLRIAAGEPMTDWLDTATPRGHAIECRINAEDPAGGRFLPSPGTITRLDMPEGPGVRFDGGFRAGDEISQFYDNLIGKLIVWAPDRATATRGMLEALDGLRIEGVATTASAARIIVGHDDFAAVRHATPWLERDVDIPESATPADNVGPVGGAEEHVVWVNDRRYILEPPLTSSSGATEVPAPRKRAPQSGNERPRAERRTRPVDGSVLAPMQGTVIKVAAAVGAIVAEGDVVCVLEAMKMENELVAPHAGIVEELHVAEGQRVSSGELLFRVRSEEQPS
ncbi:MAG TPA: biotin carboxylase N-terminal domain-containing protein [Baekduia sp.]|nr:biotin carboxylase N-terminal domain-containing protein [Baekduia sp.]